MTGKTIARYEIQSEIGRGGMAIVYLARDPNFRRNVAIKLVSSSLQEDRVFRERFEREAHLIAKIEHPAIVPVYDFGEQDNQLYLVMRYMPGGALTREIKSRTQTLAYAAQIIALIAPALDAVHAQGIVHRDLKPANILLDAFGNPAISDFGIAHMTVATVDLTGNAALGTPAYMSPEQLRGERLDGRSDVYALGAILFEILTGRVPFQAKNPLDLAVKHLNDDVPLIRTFRPDVPLEVQHIIIKAMAKDKEERYVNASELARELSSIKSAGKSTNTPAPKPAINQPSVDLPTEIYESAAQHQPLPPTSLIQPTPIQSTPPQSNNSEKAARKPSKGYLRVAMIALLGVALIFICGAVGIFGAWNSLGLPSLFQRPSLTSPPTLTALPTKSEQVTVLFEDDFSDPNTGWPTGQSQQGEYGYQSNSYRIFVDVRDELQYVATDRVYDNLSPAVDAKVVSDNANGYYGLLCRIQDENNFYYFLVRNGGEYTMGKYKDAEFQSFFADGWRQSPAIKLGDQSNRLRADCAGNTLRFYVNELLLGEVTDTDFISGFSGMVAAALGEQGYEVLFDNFLITRPGQ